MTTKTDELKPCPFCGGKASFERQGTHRQSCIVVCGSCGCRHESGYEYELSACGWNTRAALQSQDREDAPFLQEDDQHALHRFIETTEDGQGYDIGKDRIKRLAELGVVSNQGFGRYSVTAFGYWAHERYWHQNPSLPLKTIGEHNAEAAKDARRRIEGEGKS